MLRQSSPSVVTLAILFALLTASESRILPLRQIAFAQSPAAPTVPAGTTVRIDSSTSMAAVNQALKQKFEAQFSDTQVELNETGSDAALQALREKKIDIAAIGRPLTPEETAQGLVQTPLTRRKIAVVVGNNNSFPGDLTGEQFAQIFRGEIANWSQVGGANKPIRVLDRPTSDTRVALQSYPVFQSAPFQPAPNAVSITDENVDAMIQQLGDDGISYAILDQVINKPGVKIVTLYGTPPTDANYPFSQALTYVYQGPDPSPAVQAFLGYATSPDNQQTIATAGGAAANAPATSPAQPSAAPVPAVVGTANAPQPTAPPASPVPGASPQAPAATEASPGEVAQAPAGVDTDRTGLPWWLWLLSLPLIGALLWVLFRGFGGSDRSEDTATVVPPVAVDNTDPDHRIVLVPRNSHEAYAYWEVSEAYKQRIRKEEGGQQLAVRLYDVTGLEFGRHPAHSIEQINVEESDQDLHIPIAQSGRDYLAELGYVTYQQRWIKLVQSAPVHIPAADAQPEEYQEVPQSEVFPEVSPSEASVETPAETAYQETESYEAEYPDIVAPPEETQHQEVVTPPATPPIMPIMPRIEESFRGGGTPLIDPSTIAKTAPPATETPEAVKESAAAGVTGAAAATQRSGKVRRSRIVLSPRDSQNAYAYWEVLDHHKEIAKQHGGQDFILRICDVTGINLDNQSPHSIQQFNCDETDTERYVTVPSSGEYVAEIGYLANTGRWLRIARSEPVIIPAAEGEVTTVIQSED